MPTSQPVLIGITTDPWSIVLTAVMAGATVALAFITYHYVRLTRETLAELRKQQKDALRRAARSVIEELKTNLLIKEDNQENIPFLFLDGAYHSAISVLPEVPMAAKTRTTLLKAYLFIKRHNSLHNVDNLHISGRGTARRSARVVIEEAMDAIRADKGLHEFLREDLSCFGKAPSS